MLALCKPDLSDRIREWNRIEQNITKIFTILFGKRVQVELTKNKLLYRTQSNWFTLSSNIGSNNHEFALRLDSFGHAGNALSYNEEYFVALIQFGKRLAKYNLEKTEEAQRENLCFIPHFTQASPLYSYRISVFDADQNCRIKGDIAFVDFPQPVLPTEATATESNARVSVQLKLQTMIEDYAALHSKESQDTIIFKDCIAEIGTKKNYLIACGKLDQCSGEQSTKCIIQIEGDRMKRAEKTERTGRIPISLDLGSIELSVEDLVKLREGMSIEFVKPARFEANLLLADSPWASGTVELKGDVVEFTVEKTKY